jgi:hypothetical protein
VIIYALLNKNNLSLQDNHVFVYVTALTEVQITYRRMGNGKVIMNSELINNVGEYIVGNENHGISMQVQSKPTRNLIQYSMLHD